MKNLILGNLTNKIFNMKKLERKQLKNLVGGFDDACRDHLVPPTELPEPGGYYNCPCKDEVFCRNMAACINSRNGIPDFCEI
ncbi:hypothetical protein KRE40_17390 [Elizabethkingia meningoseptica]|uniref:Bacteriocin n=2 Tax=Weeksellaceae TaxID=2762318 RepID=A0A1V3U0C9_ELIME|nr:hypothetical protein BBD33_16270 [Elizabethkingia meningoseptica]EOR28411.1 hypothetical protein L100_16470 [Elizabethkingia meningoseptica ATCC 13253 = NBRC 12535]AQX10969.1 hypothetical protein BBD35_00625 [Elizabethkingia meningoseptica]AQX48763.1 hypothetical protein B5G46_16265 [Elizabethkingia meningoseptica]EJK5330047.1 hypothetical protein [Elizabethkingia meningoseptica]